MDYDKFLVEPNSKIKLKNYDTRYTGKFKQKDEAVSKLAEGIEELKKYQDMLYAHDTYSLLLIFQAMDAAGKDSTIKHVMSGINPQGCQVFSFKHPSAEELDHDYLWRYVKCLPERGRIGIFNRSYYEEVLVVRVHPEILAAQKLPLTTKSKQIWQQRFEEINNFEKYLVNNGTIVLKFFLNVSKAEQKKRFLDRINRPEKNWKFSSHDLRERGFWGDYMDAFEDVFQHTSTEWAPWYIIPADKKWFMRYVVSNIIVDKIKKLDLHYPKVSKEQKQQLLISKAMLEEE